MVITNLLWRFAERFSSQIVTFVVSIVIARLVDPSAYGTVALLMIFINILQVFIDGGLGNALIQKKDADDLDFSTVFYFNLITGILLYLLMFFLAPFIANFYHLGNLTKMIRIISLSLIISGIKNVQLAYVSKNLIFKKFFYSTLIGVSVGAISGIVLALKGFGEWALVVQYLMNTAIDTIVLWMIIDWRPIFKFSFIRFRKLFSYGWKILISGLIDQIYNDIRQLIIGKSYSPKNLAYYNRGKQFPYIIIFNINKSIDSVLFPVMVNIQNEKGKLKKFAKKSVKLSSYLIWPMMIGLFTISDSLVKLLLTDKWMHSVPYLKIFSIIYAFYPFHTANLNVLKALGRSDVFLKLEVIKKIIGVISILITMKMGVFQMAVGMLITTVISTFVNSYPNSILIDYSFKEQIKDILPSILISILMGISIYPFKYIINNLLGLIIIQTLVGASLYYLYSILFKVYSLKQLKQDIRGI